MNFSHPFYPLGVEFKQLLHEWRQTPIPAMRFTAFMHCAHGNFQSFVDQPDLQSIKVTCVTTTDVQKQPLFVRFRHHFKQELAFASRSTVTTDSGDWALQNLPYESMSAGVFAIARQDPFVQRFLALGKDDLESYSALVYEQARQLDLAFESLETAHDVGLLTAR